MSAIPYLYAISGFAVGLLVGMTGVGGGALMTPMLILLFGIHPAAAVGTDLLHAAATKTAGSIVHGCSLPGSTATRWVTVGACRSRRCIRSCSTRSACVTRWCWRTSGH